MLCRPAWEKTANSRETVAGSPGAILSYGTNDFAGQTNRSVLLLVVHTRPVSSPSSIEFNYQSTDKSMRRCQQIKVAFGEWERDLSTSSSPTRCSSTPSRIALPYPTPLTFRVKRRICANVSSVQTDASVMISVIAYDAAFTDTGRRRKAPIYAGDDPA
jgi:hypothetical protein